MHVLARKKQTEALKVVIDNGFCVDSLNSEGDTALHIACSENDIETVKELLRSGADFMVKNYFIVRR